MFALRQIAIVTVRFTAAESFAHFDRFVYSCFRKKKRILAKFLFVIFAQVTFLIDIDNNHDSIQSD